MIKRILAWCVLLAFICIFLALAVYVMLDPGGRRLLGGIIGVLLALFLLGCAVDEVVR